MEWYIISEISLYKVLIDYKTLIPITRKYSKTKICDIKYICDFPTDLTYLFENYNKISFDRDICLPGHVIKVVDGLNASNK